MMKSRPQQFIRRRMLPVLLVASTSLAATTPIRAQADAKSAVKVPGKAGATSALDVPKIAYTRFVLPNGLTVVLHEDHSTPLVSVDLEYHVGSRDDTPGKRGMAHVFEHMMFNGSANVAPGEHMETLTRAGGQRVNAYTQTENTAFVETVPTNMLETALWLEADRMAFLPARLDSERFDRERDVIVNEYAAAAENPRVQLHTIETFLEGLFSDSNPYAFTSMGVMTELKTATVRDLRAFFNRYYVPNNATLAIAGDVTIADARKLVERYFGGIPRGAPVTHPAIPKTGLATETRLAFEDKGTTTPQLWIGWRGATTTSPDKVALLALNALLTRGRSSRLYRALIDEKKLATSLPPSQNGHWDLEESGIFQFVVAANANAPMTEIERVIDSVVADVRANGVTPDELRRWQASYTVGSITRLQRTYVRDSLLAEGQLMQHNPSALFDDVATARRLTPAELRRVARKYLIPGRIVLSVVPPGKLDLVSKPSEPYVNKSRKSP
jgi:zinc protease